MKKKHENDEQEVLEFPEDEVEETSTENAPEDDSEEKEKASDASGKDSKDGSSKGDEDKGDDAASELAEMKDRYMRLLAEYDNFRKRTQKEKENIYSDAVAEVVKEWLPLVDDIERAVASSENMDADSVEKVAEGIRLIGKQVGNVLGKLGVEEIESAQGTEFDPNLHEAVMHIEDDSLGEQQIAQVFQKGYSCKGRVIRHSVVQVAN